MWYDREPTLQRICANYIFASFLCTHSLSTKHTLNQACSYNDVIIPIYILETKLNYSRDWQDLKLLELIVVCAKTNTIFNVMKVIYICQHNCSPNYLWNELHESLVIATNPYFFTMWRRTPIIVLMNLNAIANFSLWCHKWNISSTSCNTKFIFVTYSTLCINLDNLFNFTWVSIILGGLHHSIQMHAPHYSFQYKCNLIIFWHLFPFSTIQHSYWDPSCQQHKSLIAPHNMQHFHVHVQKLV
jgi:hypothetical protein